MWTRSGSTYMVVAMRHKVKNIGKPYAGKPPVRFDEGGLGNQSPTLHNYSNYFDIISMA